MNQQSLDVETFNRLLSPLLNDGWPIGRLAQPWEWRDFPPLAFAIPWLGGDLTPEQLQWFRDQSAFARIQSVTREQITRRELIVFDQQPRSLPPLLFHGTQSQFVERILAEGLKPGHLTGIRTTNFPEAELWVHFFDEASHVTTRWLSVPESRGRIASGEYSILAVEPWGVTPLLCDPCTRTGYVTDEVVPYTAIRRVEHPPIIVN